MGQRTAVLAGATGLVGQALLRELLANPAYGRVVAVGRRAPPVVHAKLVAVPTDFADFSALPDGLDDAFCCLGTTIKVAGSQAAFRRVDHDFVLAFARAVLDLGAARFAMVSSLGADVRSRVFYSRVKGETEDAVAGLGFKTLHILRPSLMRGDRAERRPVERLVMTLSGLVMPLMRGPLLRYRPLRGEAVARAMLRLMLDSGAGVQIHESERLQRVGD